MPRRRPDPPSEPVDALRDLVARLPEAGAAGAALVETHISLLLLSGVDAWKFKKPVCLPFADFRDPAERERLCRVEVELNRRLAPGLYRGVVAVRGSRAAPHLGGRGRVLEHAVHMRRFRSEDEALAALRAGRLDAGHLRRLGATLAAFHAGAEPLARDRPLGRVADLEREWREDVEALAPHLSTARLDALSTAWRDALAPLRSTIAARRRQGRVRACHGDLHLGNLVLVDDVLTPFDCIEFNDEFRYVDTFNELAFLVMDLERRARPRLAAALLDGYLDACGDWAGLAVLPLYTAYRASVRAKIAALRLAQAPAQRERRRARAELAVLVRTAERALAPPSPAPLVLMHGLSGSGKSRLAAAIASAAGLLCVRSDVERRRLHDVDTPAGHEAAYAARGVAGTYERLAACSRHALGSGRGILVDATFLAAAERRRFRVLAAELRAPFAIVAVEAPEAVLRERVERRARRGADPSQADARVLERQIATREPLSAEERAVAVGVDTSRRPSAVSAWRRVRSVARVPAAPEAL